MNELFNFNIETDNNFIVIKNNINHKIKIAGTMDKIYFCGKDVALLFEYKDLKNALQVNVSNKYKTTLKELYKNADGRKSSAYTLSSTKSITENESRAIKLHELGGTYQIENIHLPAENKNISAEKQIIFYDKNYLIFRLK